MDDVWQKIHAEVPPQAHQTIEEMSKYTHSLKRLKKILAAMNLDENWFKNKTALDIGGGSFASRDGASKNFPVFYPWMGLLLKFLGASDVKVIDKYDEKEIKPSQTNGLYKFFMKHVSMINFDILNLLKKNLELPNIQPGSIDIINSSLLISIANYETVTSPALKGTLVSLRYPYRGEHLNTESTIVLKMFEWAEIILKDGGIFLFNNEIYKKIGDKIVWINSIAENQKEESKSIP